VKGAVDRSAHGTYTPGTEMLMLVRGVASRGHVGVDLVEATPTLDPANITSTTAVCLVTDALARHFSVERKVAGL
jgi:arginase family enzyme